MIHSFGKLAARPATLALSLFLVGLASCGPQGTEDPLPRSERPPATFFVDLQGLEKGWLLTTSRLTNDNAPLEETSVVDGASVSLSGSTTDVFSGVITDQQGDVKHTIAMGARCTRKSGKRLLVPGQYPSIQEAVLAALPGETVLVAPGTYRESVRLRPGVCLSGSGVGKTILEAGNQGHNLLDLSNAPGSTVTGFTLRGVGPLADPCRGKYPVECAGSYYAAAIYIGGMTWRDPTQDAPPLVSNNLFEDNEIAMMIYWRSMVVVRNNLFVKNRFGLVANHYQSRALIANNVFYENSALAIGNQAAYLDIINNIIARSDMAIYFENIQTGWIRCNLFFGNNTLQEDKYVAPPRFSIGKDGNVSVDPLFEDGPGKNFRLRPGSPGKDAGCFRGKAYEIDGTHEDLGAYGGPLGTW